ncbi:hypothetical protein DSM110093_03138 [Sulfitobacter sp. DSM 110093]|uniref:hypothetical protein n=1 Tax=Sulfitobacter sp. DSM 110093 TaxID=2883127 RepID=UPI001FABD5DA|nr:hypothetical protein [Sulfitobacter sp. DSM 110093]UOA33313.1 hypothetical protein DSM110093_03138 [Sulfitobacter sp. DSM 110093]
MANNGAKEWAAELARRQQAGDGLEFSPDNFLRAIGGAGTDDSFEMWLKEKVCQGELEALQAWKCPVEGCERVIDKNELEANVCPKCGTDFQEVGENPIRQLKYRAKGDTSRDIYWMIVIHGMNTRGAWQEELSWRLANKFKYSAPVLIFKYGLATIDVLVKCRHQSLVNKLGIRIRKGIQFAREHNSDHRPDVIVHSFGSQLFALLLENEQFCDLKFGRVITVGSIIHPDFDWSKHIDSGKIEAVLNHVGQKDIPVRAAQFFIPGTGPSGQKGFKDSASINVSEQSYGHSSAFEPSELKKNLGTGGLWDQFLQNPLNHFKPFTAFHLKEWKPFFVLVRCFTRLLGYLIFAILAPVSFVRRFLDP